MLTFEQAIADQEDLKRLCADRPYRSSELYWPNDNYGLARVIKLYSSYPENRPLPTLVPHGVYFGDDVYDGEAETPFPAVLSYPEFRDAAYRSGVNKLVIPSASPFLYAYEMMGRPTVPGREGTLFAPLHSTVGMPTHTDWYDLARELAKLDDVFKPITVCLHWHDFQLGAARSFAKRGFRVVSAGHLHDLDFLFRLIHLMSQHKYAASNDVGSNLFYSVAAGMPYFMVSEPPGVYAASADMQAAIDSGGQAAQTRVEEVRALFAEPTTEISPEQRECADYYLGASRFKSPAEVLIDLQFAQQRDAW